MTKIDIISGFLGAGKTTLIKKLLEEVYVGEKLVLIENEFGEIGIDGGFLKDAGIAITEMNSGCICCSLVGDFGAALKKVLAEYAPDRIIIEPSGVGKLSDVVKAVQRVGQEVPMELGCFVTVADATKCKLYLSNFGEFYSDQIESAKAIILSRTQAMDPAKLNRVVELLRKHNAQAPIITTPWDVLTGKQIMDAMAGISLADELLKEEQDEHDEHCTCGCHDHDHEHEHEHDEHCTCGCHDHEHEHEHEHDEHCTCGCHDHDHEHGHHHADEVFTSWGVETPKHFTRGELFAALNGLEDDRYGMVLRAKGIVAGEDGQWYHFDYVPGESNIRTGGPDYTGRLCVIGSKLDTAGLRKLFQV